MWGHAGQDAGGREVCIQRTLTSEFIWGTEASVSEGPNQVREQPTSILLCSHCELHRRFNFWSFLKGSFYCQVYFKRIVPCERTWNHAVHSWRRWWRAATKHICEVFRLQGRRCMVTFFNSWSNCLLELIKGVYFQLCALNYIIAGVAYILH